MVTNKYCFVFLLLLLIPFISSTTESLGTFEKNTNVELIQLCSNSTSICDYCNISSIKYPKNYTTIVSNVEMTKRVADFNYTLDQNFTDINGIYDVNGFCGASDGVQVFSYTFKITPNGKEEPGAGIVVFFSLLFLIVVGGLLFLLLYNIYHMITWDFDVQDLLMNISAYFILFVVYILGKEYLGNSFVDDFLVWILGATSLTNFILPIIAFFMSYVKGGIENSNG